MRKTLFAVGLEGDHWTKAVYLCGDRKAADALANMGRIVGVDRVDVKALHFHRVHQYPDGNEAFLVSIPGVYSLADEIVEADMSTIDDDIESALDFGKTADQHLKGGA